MSSEALPQANGHNNQEVQSLRNEVEEVPRSIESSLSINIYAKTLLVEAATFGAKNRHKRDQ